MSTSNERDVHPLDEMTRIAQEDLRLHSRGFIETYRSSETGELIYNSEWCRINLIWEGWDPADGNSIDIRYGRLHAPSNKSTMFCNGEESHCWHRIEYPLHFLDGRTPAEAARLNYSHSIKDQFREVDFMQQFFRRQPEWLAQMHVRIWQDYGNRFFELFDLRHPMLWPLYQQFLKEVYDIRGRNPAIQPSLDKVC